MRTVGMEIAYSLQLTAYSPEKTRTRAIARILRAVGCNL
jgi:hypothetical protein